MKKLIAKRPIQYLGRTYGPGDALPAHDGRMVEAWTRAGTAVWEDTEAALPANYAAAVRAANNALAADTLRDMGVTIEDDAGNFIGAAALAEQIMALGRESAQAGESAEGPPELLTGHLDAADLERWKKADLEKLAGDMGVDISGAKNNAERAALIAAVTVQAPAQESGAAQ